MLRKINNYPLHPSLEAGERKCRHRRRPSTRHLRGVEHCAKVVSKLAKRSCQTATDSGTDCNSANLLESHRPWCVGSDARKILFGGLTRGSHADAYLVVAEL